MLIRVGIWFVREKLMTIHCLISSFYMLHLPLKVLSGLRDKEKEKKNCKQHVTQFFDESISLLHSTQLYSRVIGLFHFIRPGQGSTQASTSSPRPFLSY